LDSNIILKIGAKTMMRISMSLPRKLLNEFDEVLKDRGYQSRSKGIRDALKDYITRYQWMNDMEGDRIGILAVIYDYQYTGVMEDLTDIQHDFRQYINSVMHVHMTENYILDVMVVKGDVKYIRDLTEKIMRLKGVEHVKLTSTASGEMKKISSIS
jgi:CopG family transcriptional regulator, nickel-responsive regulator